MKEHQIWWLVACGWIIGTNAYFGNWLSFGPETPNEIACSFIALTLIMVAFVKSLLYDHINKYHR